MLPQVGQGAIAVECRRDDPETRAALAAMDDPVAHRELDAERAFLARLGGGCDLPVGAFATVEGDRIRVRGLIASLDGRVVLRSEADGPAVDGPQLGERLAGELLDAGGSELLVGAGS
jgi:hydroxymethylbilane synthase